MTKPPPPLASILPLLPANLFPHPQQALLPLTPANPTPTYTAVISAKFSRPCSYVAARAICQHMSMCTATWCNNHGCVCQHTVVKFQQVVCSHSCCLLPASMMTTLQDGNGQFQAYNTCLHAKHLHAWLLCWWLQEICLIASDANQVLDQPDQQLLNLIPASRSVTIESVSKLRRVCMEFLAACISWDQFRCPCCLFLPVPVLPGPALCLPFWPFFGPCLCLVLLCACPFALQFCPCLALSCLVLTTLSCTSLLPQFHYYALPCQPALPSVPCHAYFCPALP